MGHYGSVSRKLVSEKETTATGDGNRRDELERKNDECVGLKRPACRDSVAIAVVNGNGNCDGEEEETNGRRIEENIARLRDYHEGSLQQSGQSWSLVLVPCLLLAFLGFIVTTIARGM